MNKYKYCVFFFLVFIMCSCTEPLKGINKKDLENTGHLKQESMYLDDELYQAYLQFFQDVYKTMSDNYYKDIKRSRYDRFLTLFNEKIYARLRGEGKSSDFVKWRSAAFLVDALKEQEDIFSAFFPPKPAKEYEQTALGKKIDLGIEGIKQDRVFRVDNVEIRSDAYQKGLRIGDRIYKIGEKEVETLTEKVILDLLSPFEGEALSLYYRDEGEIFHTIQVTSQEYFKQMVFLMPTKLAGIYGLRIKRFNRKTAEDVFRFLEMFRTQKPNGLMRGLILDLRDNPGGPPLAAREISAFFLRPGEVLTYFKKHNQPRVELDIPKIPSQYHIRVPMVIFIDKNSGSAAEMFAGVMQKKGRAILMGEDSAGQVMLKSMFHFDDESMLLLITQRGHYPDGSVFSFDGLTPDRRIAQMQGENLLDYASKYLFYVSVRGLK